MPGSIPATSQLDWLISTTAMIVLSWSRATRDLLKSFGWGIGALHRFTQRRWCHLLAACPIASLGPTPLSRCGRPRSTSIRMSFREGPEFADSLLEGDGFELPVPREISSVSRFGEE